MKKYFLSESKQKKGEHEVGKVGVKFKNVTLVFSVFLGILAFLVFYFWMMSNTYEHLIKILGG